MDECKNHFSLLPFTETISPFCDAMSAVYWMLYSSWWQESWLKSPLMLPVGLGLRFLPIRMEAYSAPSPGTWPVKFDANQSEFWVQKSALCDNSHSVGPSDRYEVLREKRGGGSDNSRDGYLLIWTKLNGIRWVETNWEVWRQAEASTFVAGKSTCKWMN